MFPNYRPLDGQPVKFHMMIFLNLYVETQPKQFINEPETSSTNITAEK